MSFLDLLVVRNDTFTWLSFSRGNGTTKSVRGVTNLPISYSITVNPISPMKDLIDFSVICCGSNWIFTIPSGYVDLHQAIPFCFWSIVSNPTAHVTQLNPF